MEGAASLKVPAGKLLRVKVQFKDVIEHIEITGDFFMHPEECLREIEQGLVGLKSNASADDILARMKQCVNLNLVQFVGVTPEDIAQTVLRALL